MKLDEALLLLEVGDPAASIKDALKKILSGDFKNLQEAFFKAREGNIEYPNQLERLLRDVNPKSPAGAFLRSEIAAAKVAKRAFEKSKLGKFI